MRYFLIFIFLILITKFHTTNEEIVFVFEHFRHGASSSIYIDKYNKDMYNIKWIGDGELTPIGMRMQYLIGVHIRNKYSNIINRNTSSKELLVYSTDLNRTILSAESQLLGMFPPMKGEEIPEDEMYKTYPPNKISNTVQNEINKLGNISLPSKIRAIPINFFHKEKKPYLLTDENECPKTKYIKENNYKKKDIQEFIKKFKEKYSVKLMEYFKITDAKVFNYYYYLYEVINHFIFNYIHKRKHLIFFEESGINLTEYYEDCMKFKNLSMYEIEITEEVGIMASSPIYKDIIFYMDNIIKSNIDKFHKKTTETKFVMYSGHDYIMVAAQLYLHAVFGIECSYPRFASNQFFELHKQDGINDNKLNEKHFYVQYFYNGNLLLNISYPEFKEKLSEIMWSKDQIIDFCKVENYSFVDYLLYSILSFSLISITFAMIKETCEEKKEQNSKNKYNIYKNYQMKDN